MSAGLGQGAAGRHLHGLTVIAHHARGEGAVGLADRVHQRAQRDAVQGQLGRIGLDADLVGPAADDEGQADVVDLGDLGAQLAGDLIERLVGPLTRRRRAWATGSARDLGTSLMPRVRISGSGMPAGMRS